MNGTGRRVLRANDRPSGVGTLTGGGWFGRRWAGLAAGPLAVVAVAGLVSGTGARAGQAYPAAPPASSGFTAYVVNQGMVFGNRQGTVTPISTATNTPGRTITLGPHAETWAYTPDGRTVYVSDLGFSVTPISVGTGKAGKSIPLHMEGGVGSMAITPDGRTLYVASFKDNEVLPISVATNTAGKPLNVTGEVLDLVMTPDGRNAYTFSSPANTEQVVTPISTATSTVGKPIKTAPDTVVLIPGDQNTLYLPSAVGRSRY